MAKVVEIAVVNKAKKYLDKLEQKPATVLPVQEALESIKDSLEAAKAKGYSNEEILEMLKSQGIEANAYALKKLLRKERKQQEQS